MVNKISRRATIITGVAASAIIAAPTIASAEGNPKTPTPENDGSQQKGTTIVDKPLNKEEKVPAEIEELEIPSNIAPEEPNAVLQGAEGRNVQEYATMVACSWKGDDPDSVEVRALSTDDKWSEWFRLDPIGDNETPATEAAWIGPSVSVEVRAAVNGEDISEQVTAHLIATSEEKEDEAPKPQMRTFSTMSTAAVPTGLVTTDKYQPGYQGPNMYSRKYWGAKESLSRSVNARDSTKAIFIHHTAGSNNYTQAQAAQQIRGMYEYHTKTLGWADIGYNVIVDKYGRIYEGRHGGLSKNIQGSHSLGFNKETFGISVMGNYSSQSFPAAAVDAVAKIAGWKLHGTFNYNATAKAYYYVTTGGIKYPKNKTASINIISGHRDVNYTECPGNTAYKQLPAIRTKAQYYANVFYKGHYNAFVAAGGASKYGTVTNTMQGEGNYQVTRLTKGIVLSVNGKDSRISLSSFADDWDKSWGRPTQSTSSTTSQAFENGTAKRSNGRVTFVKKTQSFTDVPTTSAQFVAIEALAARGIIKGYSNGTFRPNHAITRAQVFTMLYNAMGSPSYTPPKVSPFSDVSKSNSYYKIIAWAHSKGIIGGAKQSDGRRKIEPSMKVNRNAVAQFIFRASALKAYKPSSTKPYTDVNTKTICYKEIGWGKDKGIINGYKDGSFRPTNTVSRGDTSVFIYNWMNYMKLL